MELQSNHDSDYEDDPIPQPQYQDDATSTFSTEDTITVGQTALYYPSDASYDDLVATAGQPSPCLKYIPLSVLNLTNTAGRWIRGPQPPRPWKIKPFFPSIQTAPIKFLDRFFPKRKHRILLLLLFYACWLFCFGMVLHKSAFASDVPGYGSPTRITCTSRYWNKNNGCGINGNGCRPFDNATFAFRCPANCKPIHVFNPYAVGDKEVTYKPLVIGGPESDENNSSTTHYRGDSFICGAAIHAGFINDKVGGCGVLSLTGEQTNFPESKRHGISSIGFSSYFPQSFTFLRDTASQCRDLRWPLLGVSLTFTILLSLFTTAPPIFFPSVFFGIFFHVALASDPPSLTDYYSIVSIALGRFLPASFCAFVIYKFSAKPTLTGLDAQIEKTILWLGGCWIGALNNYTFDKIPIERLTPHDIKQQPGAVPALIIIVLSLFCIALGQAWCLRIEGKLPRYLVVYGIICGTILALVCVPRMNVRIHHYILALALLPGTGMQTRPSLLYQGLLVGLFINGIARWGFDSILQTPLELRGDASIGSPLPVIVPPVVHNNFGTHHKANITFEWMLPLPEGYDGVSVLVNDVERFRGFGEHAEAGFTWVRKDENLPEYFRFGFMSGRRSADYTKAGTWGVDGGWTEMRDGAT